MEPWIDLAEEKVRALLAGTPFEAMAKPRDLAFGLIAFYLGLDMMTHLDGDRCAPQALFDLGARLSTLVAGFLPQPKKGEIAMNQHRHGRRNRGIQLHRQVHRARAARRGPQRQDDHQPPRPRRSLRRPRRARPLPLRRPGRPGAQPRGRDHALQHLLGPLPARRPRLRRRRRQLEAAVRRGARGRRRADRARQRQQPAARRSARLLPRQGAGRAGPCPGRHRPRDRAPDARLWHRGRADQQHRLDAALGAAVHGAGRRRLQGATGLGRRGRTPVSARCRRPERRPDRLRRPGAAELRRANLWRSPPRSAAAPGSCTLPNRWRSASRGSSGWPSAT